MTDYAAYQFTVTDEDGNVIPGASVEVRSETIGGTPLATLFSGRTGGALANPAPTDADGFIRFFVADDFYKIRVYTGPSGSPTFEQIHRYVPISMSQGYSSSTTSPWLIPDGSVAAPGLAFSNDTDTGFYRSAANNIGLILGGILAISFYPGGMNIVGGTLSAGLAALILSATQPATPVTAQNAANFQITSAGSAAQINRALNVDYLAGYTGASNTTAARFANAAAGTETGIIPASGSVTSGGNQGLSGLASATTTGSNAGLVGRANGGNVSVGVVGLAQIAKNSATNIGGAFSAINTGTTPVQIGLWVSLNQTTVPTASAALIVDNVAQTDPIARFRDNGTDVFTIADGGAVSIVNTSASGFTVGPSGTNTLLVDSSTASQAAGLSIKGAATAGTVRIDTTDSGSNATLQISAKGTGGLILNGANSGIITACNSLVVQSILATGFTVSVTGQSNAVFTVDCATGSAVAGLKVTGAVTGGTVAIVATDSGSNTNVTFNAKGSGTIVVGGTSTGNVTIGGGGGSVLIPSPVNVASATATPAGGSTSARLVFGTTSGFGIYYGSGAPTVTAAAGSLYIRTDNAGANLRLYSNTTGSTTWAAITSA